MERKYYTLLIVCIFTVSLVLVALYAYSPVAGDIYVAGFNRNFAKSTVVAQKAVLDIKVNSYYIAGMANNKIYLGNPTAPFIMSSTDISLKELSQVRLKISELDSVKYGEKFRLSIDSPHFFLLNGAMPKILRGRIDDTEAKPIMVEEDYFDQAAPLGSGTFALRSYNLSEKSYELAKQTVDSPYFRFENSLLQKQLDGIFCLDGQLHYSRDLKLVVYHHYYRNELVIADSNLNLLYRTHTIDTFSRSKVKVAKIDGENTTMITGIPRQVNAKARVFDKYLFVNSNLLAKNEQKSDFFSKEVIDVYSLIDGATYLSSFYIPHYLGQRPTDFLFFKGHVVAIYDHYLILYGLDLKEFLSTGYN